MTGAAHVVEVDLGHEDVRVAERGLQPQALGHAAHGALQVRLPPGTTNIHRENHMKPQTNSRSRAQSVWHCARAGGVRRPSCLCGRMKGNWMGKSRA